ncbi:MAG: hypothetical protein J5746_11300 [Victivallales bacterium]|nr:hypothetical protein [Victivallales bacterium]
MRKVLFSIWLCFAVSILSAAEFSVPFLKKAPVIDGQFDKGEWDFATAFSGSKKIDARRTTIWMGYDAKNLYLAMQAETPPRGGLSTGARAISMQDSLEVWFSPPQKLRKVESLKFGAFQLIINSEDKFMAMHNSPGYGLAATDWKHNAKIKSSVKNRVWTLEMAFPMKEMGITGSPEGDWRILVCRNYGIVPVYQAPMTDAGSFIDPNTYSVFHLSKDCLAVQHLYGEDARLPLRLRIANPTSKTANADIVLNVSNGKEPSKINVSLPAGAAKECDFTKEYSAEGDKCNVEINTSGWSRSLAWVPPQPPIWRNTESFQTLFCGFDAGKENIVDYCTREDTEVKMKKDAELPTVQGPVASRKILDFTGKTVEFPRTRLTSPGAVSFWMRVAEPLPKEKSFRRFFGTVFRNNGYIYFQEQRDGGLLIGAQYFPNNKNGKNTLLGRRPQPGQWMHLAFNFLPDAMEVYVNGILRVTLSHKLNMDLSTVGGALLANAAFADFGIYSRPLTAAEITLLSQGDKVVNGTVRWFQGIEQAVVDLVLDCKAVPDKKLQLQIRNDKDKVMDSFSLDFNTGFSKFENGHEMATLHLALPLNKKLPDGKYSFFMSMPGSDNPLYERAFEVKAYPWLGNKIGMNDRLITGFTPLKRNGNKLSAVLKDMTLGKNGLPESVVANGEPVLARPIEVVAETNGKKLSWKCSAPKFSKETGTTIEANSKMECDALKIDAQIRMEQDGLIRYDWKLAPGKKPLPTRLYVDIPIRKEVATLYHAVAEGLRHNPGGFVPKGKGLVFSSRIIPQKHFDSFLPYIWVGNDYRGLCYTADWDKGWCHSKTRDGVELHREKDGTVVIRLNLLNEPKKLASDPVITFALLASPVKPMPEGWRGWRDAYTANGTQLSRCLYSNLYWGSYYNVLGRYPAFGDFEYWDKLFEAQKTGKFDKEYIEAWLERAMKAYGTVETGWVNAKSREEARKYFSNHAYAAFRTLAGLNKYQDKSIVYCYTCNADSAAKLPEYPVMRDEWAGGQMLNKSYVDYAIYYLDKMLEHGFKGIYNDNVFFAGNTSWPTGSGWIDDEGTVHYAMGLWRSREYHRRQAVAMMDRGIRPWITAHHTNTNILATLGYTTNTMGMEWKYGVNDFQERFTSDYIRAVCSGRSGGFYPTVLDGIVGAKTQEIKDWATRTMLASLLPHEVQPTCPRGSNGKLIAKTLDKFYDFGTHEKDCKVYNFWDEKSSVKCSNDDLKQVTYQRGKELLTFIGSFADKDCEAEMQYGSAIAKAVNDENAQPLEASGSKVTFTLKKHDFIIIRATMK